MYQMMKRTRFILLASLILALLAGDFGVTGASFTDGESSVGNVLQAWLPSMWVQTYQADFAAGVLNNVDITTSLDNVIITSASNWYDVNWSRRAPVDINNPGSNLTNYQVRVDITYDADMQPDFSDIRFLDSDNSTELSHWRESYTASTSATFWVRVPSIPSGTKTIYLYYGNPAASSASDGWSTFEFFDDFSAGLGQWTIDAENTDKVYISTGAGNPSPSLRHDPDSSQTKNGYFDTRLITNTYQMLDGIIEYDVYLAGTRRIIHQLGWRVPSLNFENGYCWRLQTAEADGGHLRFTGRASWSTFGTPFNFVSANTWHSVKEIVSGSTYTGYVDGGIAYSGTNSTKLTADYLVSHVHGVSLDASSYVLVDNIRVRQYVSPEPTSNMGPEESSGYVSVGTLASKVFDTGVASATWNGLSWDETLTTGTDITFEVRASDTPFAKDTPSGTLPWIPIGGTSPVISGLPSGRYMQWQATLTTSDPNNTPTLHEVIFYYN
jgi:hypothetical protein